MVLWCYFNLPAEKETEDNALDKLFVLS